jgi:hypothetical protein
MAGLRKFSFSELEVATHHFSEENMIGSGAFATVYKVHIFVLLKSFHMIVIIIYHCDCSLLLA